MIWIAGIFFVVACFLAGVVYEQRVIIGELENLLNETEQIFDEIKDDRYGEKKGEKENSEKENEEIFKPVRHTFIDKNEPGPCKLKFREENSADYHAVPDSGAEGDGI